MSFLPKDYKAPEGGSNYMKFVKGANKFRILSDAVTGWEYWLDENGKRKPVRVHEFDEVPANKKSGEDSAKHFFAFVVYNYNSEKIELLEVTQQSIRKSLEVLDKDEDWGDPKGYDIVVTATGDGLDREYQTNPKPHSKVSFKDPGINLDALFTGDDPFNTLTTKDATEKVTEDKESVDLEDINLDDLDTVTVAHSPATAEKYFTVMTKIGKNEKEAKEFAKEKLGIDDFNNISDVKLKTLASALEMKLKSKKKVKPVEEIVDLSDLDGGL